MLRVGEHFERTDTGRQRRVNEDAFHARAPLFIVADGMGGAQAGEVASGTAVEMIPGQIAPDGGSVEQRLADAVQAANARIHELSVSDDERAGMGTTLTAAWVGEKEVTLVHVGDSRCYRWRDGGLERLTDDHSLVEEMVRQGRLTPEEAAVHPQRSIITRALGPEGVVEPDTLTVPARGGDLFLLCSDGLTSMIGEDEIAAVLASTDDIEAVGRALVDRANEAGGRDNITVVLFRLEGVGTTAEEEVELTRLNMEAVSAPAAAVPAAAAVERREPRAPRPAGKKRGWRPGFGTLLIVVLVVAIAAGGYLASQAVYFVGSDSQGFVTVYQGVPYELPAGISLYREDYTSGLNIAQLPAAQRKTVAEHQL
ncbi:MAG: Stp1/IreP family PP2C-type Ser/Thr phosphatase, partial [Solirubrobacteraceae bacterium]|nr:Stp1/IreP family PP2C-type Ser/Thr phosphatase [Solirubrobacteraceae bacterium]